jgi:LysR family transcriptional regulator for metE and metH
MVAADRGVTALANWLIDELDNHANLVYRPLGKHGLPKTLYIGHRKTNDALGFVEEFIKLACEVRA